MARFARLFLIPPGLALVLAACGSVHAGTASPDAATPATATAAPASQARTAGCTGVHQVVPQFPAALCAGLPAMGP